MRQNIIFQIYYLTVGSGHQKAAEAVHQAVQNQFPDLETKVLDPFSHKIKVLPSLLELGLISSNYLLPELYDKTWREGNKQGVQLVRKAELLRRILTAALEPSKDNIIIATHGLPCLIASAIKPQHCVSRVFGVITDYGAHSFWHQTKADGIFCSHNEVAGQLHAQGVPTEGLFVTGIPINKQYASIPRREEQQNPASLQILFIAGGMRGGPYLEIERSATDIIYACEEYGPPNMHLTIITGKNQRLFDHLRLLQPSLNLSLTVQGFVTNMYQYMARNDVIITKPGGLITAESLAAGLGMILLKPGPGQESANESFLLRHGAALAGDTNQNLKSSLRELHSPEVVARLRQRAFALGKPNAAQDVVNILKDSLGE